jgi:hypothetical protein
MCHALARFFSARSSIRNFCASKFLSAADAPAFPPGLDIVAKTEKEKKEKN